MGDSRQHASFDDVVLTFCCTYVCDRSAAEAYVRDLCGEFGLDYEVFATACLVDPEGWRHAIDVSAADWDL